MISDESILQAWELLLRVHKTALAGADRRLALTIMFASLLTVVRVKDNDGRVTYTNIVQAN